LGPAGPHIFGGEREAMETKKHLLAQDAAPAAPTAAKA
jgi:hypothetical protein